MNNTIDTIKKILATIKALPGAHTDLPDTADIVNDVKLDSIEMLQFMLELEAKLAIRIDFEKLEFSSLNSIRTLAEFLDTMPSTRSPGAAA
jgi:acyl carrier protein